jgi:uncharacterized protein YbjT (DUF2867 family)
MILVTGGTGFIGQALIRQLIASGYQVRTLIRPSQKTPNLPRGVPMDVVVSSLLDEKGVRAAMRDVDLVFHLVGGESRGATANLTASDVQTTQVVTRAGVAAGIQRLVYVSHLGADKSSAYPVMKAKGIAEGIIKTSGIDYTIFRSAIIYGPGDHFTESLRKILLAYPLLYVLPDNGYSQLQPFWIDDLVTCLVWSVEGISTKNRVIEIGGSENFSFRQISEMIKGRIGTRNVFFSIKSSYLRWITLTMASLRSGFPLSSFWLDYLAENHQCALDSATREFGILPARFTQKIDYLDQIQRKK